MRQRKKLNPDFVRQEIGARVASLETSYDTLVGDMARIEKGQEEMSNRIDRLREAISQDLADLGTKFSDARRTPWAVLLQAGILVILLAGATLTPVWITTTNINSKAQQAVDWQKDYSLNKIPSSSLPALATLRQNLKEVETQFRGTDELRNVQFAEMQRKLEELQDALNGLGAKYPLSPKAPHYSPHVAVDHQDPEAQ